MVTEHASVRMMTIAIGAYQAMYFENVAEAVDYCQALVSHIVPRPGASNAREERAVVWFHVPSRSQSSTRDGCYLFASPGAIAAAERAGLDTPLCGRVSRGALPADAVLLFGDDAPPMPAGRHTGRRHAGPRRVGTLGGITTSPADARV
jgi:hypothetical protein